MVINNKRALAYSSKVLWVRPIEGADNIELIGVLGWTCIAKKEEFKEGDMCVYFEIDSKLPEKPWSEFMANKKYKVKTMRLGKFNVVSQGLALPYSAFSELGIKLPLEENVDLTDTLEVKYSVDEDNIRKASDSELKYQSMMSRKRKLFKKPFFQWLLRYAWGRKVLFAVFGRKKDKPRSFPKGFPYVSKTDEERVENMPWVLGYENPLIVTEKLDGTSCTYILERKRFGKFEFYVSSRNVRQLSPNQETYHAQTKQATSNIYWDLAIKYDIENKLKDYLKEHKDLKYVCIQGEGVGHVQGNPLKLKEDDLYVFNFIRSDIGRLDSVQGREVIAGFDMKWVPIISIDYHMPETMEEFKLFADGKSVVNPNVKREGYVLRDPKTGLSFKNVSREYLLSKKD